MSATIPKFIILAAAVVGFSDCWRADRLITPHYNNLLSTVTKLGPSFFIKFDLRVNSFKTNRHGQPHSAVLHFTASKSRQVCCGYGTRVPGVFLESSGNQAVFAMSVDGVKVIYSRSPRLHEHRWYNFEIKQVQGKLEIFCDGVRFHQYYNHKPVAFYNVQVGSTFPDNRSNGDPPAKATIRNLEFNNFQH